jgi:hypothetical protein
MAVVSNWAHLGHTACAVALYEKVGLGRERRGQAELGLVFGLVLPGVAVVVHVGDEALSRLLCQGIDVERVGRGRLQEVPDAAGEVAFEAADGLGAGLFLGALAGGVDLRFGGGSGRG